MTIIDERNPANMKLSLVDLFCGAGGFSLGFEATKQIVSVCGVDSNHDAVSTYRNNRPRTAPAVLKTRVEALDSTALQNEAESRGFHSVDIILAGPPCRPYSNANRHLDARWSGPKLPNEIQATIDLVRRLAPKVVVLENVPQLLRISHGGIFESIKRELGVGYNVEPNVLDSAAFGVPQRRNRLFIACTRRDLLSPPKVLGSFESFRRPTVRDAIGDLPSLGARAPRLPSICASQRRTFIWHHYYQEGLRRNSTPG